MNVIIETEGLSKWFGEVIAVNNLSVTLEQGVTGLLGPNGAGKSTFIRLVVGLFKPSRGHIHLYGQPPRNNLPVMRQLGYCPEQDAFFDGMSGYEFVFWLNRYYGMTRREARTAALEALDQVSMTDRMKDKIATYSKGMRQRTKIAQAIAQNPELLVLDEPMQGLDPKGREDMFALIRRLGDEGRSVLISSHILYEIERVTDNVLLLHQGSVLAHGPVRHIRDLIDEHPHAVTIVGEDIRVVAEAFASDASTLAIEFQGDQAIIRTQDPNTFYQKLNDLILDEKLRIETIQCSDDNLQSVFGYLVHRETDTRTKGMQWVQNP